MQSGHQKARTTRRRNARLGMPGRLRRRVAEILSDHFEEYIDPTYIRPVQGSSPYADCYRWELSQTSRRYLGCWVTMTEFVRDAKRFGVRVEDGEIWPNYPKAD